MLMLIVGVCLTNVKTLLSVRVERPMNVLVLFGFLGLPFVHIQFSYTVATVIVLVIMLLLNSWVIYTMYKEKLANEIITEKGVCSIHGS